MDVGNFSKHSSIAVNYYVSLPWHTSKVRSRRLRPGPEDDIVFRIENDWFIQWFMSELYQNESRTALVVIRFGMVWRFKTIWSLERGAGKNWKSNNHVGKYKSDSVFKTYFKSSIWNLNKLKSGKFTENVLPSGIAPLPWGES